MTTHPMPISCPRCGATIDADTAERDERGRVVCAACPAVIVRHLEVSSELRGLLAQVRQVRAPMSRLAVRAGKLAHVERAIGSVVPDAVIAFLVAIGEPLERVIAQTAERATFAETTFEGVRGRAVAASARSDLITFDRAGDWPVISCGFRPTTDRGEPALVMWDWKSWTALPASPPPTLARYVREWYALGDGDRLPPIGLTAAPSPEVLAAFDPVIEDREAIETAPREVEHAKFGKGRVLREIDGKLEIDFGDAGIKTLLSRFVTDLS
jgi:hypothetical protein